MKTRPRSARRIFGLSFCQEIDDLRGQEKSPLAHIIFLCGDLSEFAEAAKVTINQTLQALFVSSSPFRDELADRFQGCGVLLQTRINTADAIIVLLFCYGADVIAHGKTLQIFIPLLRGSCRLL